jgi:hypothetical protein
MKPQNLIHILIGIACFGLLPGAHAVSPPPDGGYLGGNTAEGQDALLSLTTGTHNTANGFLSLKSNRTGNFNTAIGSGALLFNTADQNTATGAGALLSNTTGNFNTANGEAALFFNTTGDFNTANGYQALFNNTTGNFNIALGSSAGASLTTGDSNIDIGNVGFPGESRTIRIGGPQTKTFIAGIRGVTIGGTAIPVLIDGNSQLGMLSSAHRFKKEIQPMDNTSEAILALKPVSSTTRVTTQTHRNLV